MKKLTCEQELSFIQEMRDNEGLQAALEEIRQGFQLLQSRSQLLLGLVTICLTITGFSGPRIAETGPVARLCISFGVLNVMICAILLVCGPLQIRWLYRYSAESAEKTLLFHLARRNHRTFLYHLAAVFLLFGLTGYVSSLFFYLA